MKFFGRLLIGLVVILVLFIGGISLWLYGTDLGRYKSEIETVVSEQTGRKFTIDGDLELKLLPEPHLRAENVSLANAAWGSAPALATIGQLVVDIDLKSLINRPIIIREFLLADVELLLEVNEQGVANTTFATESSTEPDSDAESPPPSADDSGASGLPVMVEHAELRNITVIQRAPGTEDQVTRIEALTIAADEANRLALNGSAQIMQRPLTIAGTLGPIDQVQSLGAVSLDLGGSWGNAGLDINGQIANLHDLEGVELDAKLSIEEMSKLIKTLDLPLKHSGPLQANIKYSNPRSVDTLAVDATTGDIAASLQATRRAKNVQFNGELRDLATLGKALGVEELPAQPLTLDGQLAMSGNTLSIDSLNATLASARAAINGTASSAEQQAQLQISINGDSLQDLRDTLPPIPFQATVEATLEPQYVNLENLFLKVQDSIANGRVELDTRSKTQRVAVDLKSDLIDLTPFTRTEEKTAPEGTTSTDTAVETAPAGAGESKPPRREYVFVDEPLPFRALKYTDADINILINRLRNHDTDLRNVRLTNTLHKQDLNLELALEAAEGGKAIADISLNTAGDGAVLDVVIRASELQIRKDNDGEGGDRASPKTDITIDIDSKGYTPRKLAASSNGRVLVTQGAGQVENAMLDRFSGDILAQLFSALNPLAEKEKYTRWDCTVLSVDIVDGQAAINGMLLQAEKIMVVGGGDIDLKTEELTVEFNTKPRKGVGISADMFVTPFVQLGGTLAHPKLELNTKGAVLTTGAAVATMGLSLLVTGVAERATAEGDKCEPTLAALPPHAPIK